MTKSQHAECSERPNLKYSNTHTEIYSKQSINSKLTSNYEREYYLVFLVLYIIKLQPLSLRLLCVQNKLSEYVILSFGKL